MADMELPESEMQFQALSAKGLVRYRSCITCSNVFTKANVKTLMGWRETQISGICENCFDKMFEKFDDL